MGVPQSVLEQHKDQIEVHYLPSYSPELNPEEYLNGCLKNALAQQAPAKNEQELQANIIKIMRSHQAQPHKVASLFRHPAVAYAA
ncbi:transposase [Gammaproteobacteria bacterium]|nr:transposase [Gammaproteobacteria bacterium]